MAAPIAMCLNQAYRRAMENDATQHWHQTNTIREAARELDRIDSYDTVLIDYEHFVGMQTDTNGRIRDLLDLTEFYHREFGVHFEKRHAYRDQLQRVLAGELMTIDQAKEETQAAYVGTDGLGLPRLERIARFGIAA